MNGERLKPSHIWSEVRIGFLLLPSIQHCIGGKESK